GPEEGRLASGQVGRGRLSEVDTIIGWIRHVLGKDGDLAGKKVVVTAGGTHEAIDPVRFVGNSSSGKMGFALAEAARDRGANVVLVSGPSALPDPVAVEIVRVRRAAEMRDAVIAGCADADILIMAAAVADYQPAETVRDKIKRRQSETLSIPLVPTPDILAEVGVRAGLIKVGFAAESQDLLENARQKIQAKHLDLIVANDITASDAGFATDNNRVVILDRGGRKEELPLMLKYDVAWHILDRIVSLLAGKKSQPEAYEARMSDGFTLEKFARHPFYQEVNRRLVAITGLHRGQCVVDLASGTAAVTRLLAEQVACPEAEVIAVEPS